MRQHRPIPPQRFGRLDVAVALFVENPDRATAEAFLTSGWFTWNSGMFLFRASAILKDGVEEPLGENLGTYIPLGAKHRLSNPGKIPVELIEVQSGPYLGEDDIVRFEDRYGRSDQQRQARTVLQAAQAGRPDR